MTTPSNPQDIHFIPEDKSDSESLIPLIRPILYALGRASYIAPVMKGFSWLEMLGAVQGALIGGGYYHDVSGWWGLPVFVASIIISAVARHNLNLTDDTFGLHLTIGRIKDGKDTPNG